MVNAKLDLFKTPPTDISTSSYLMVPIQPFTTGTTPIDFQVYAQINMRLNRTLISEQTDTYHYKAYMETLLHNNRQRR